MRSSVFHKEGEASVEARFEQQVSQVRQKVYHLAYRMLGNQSDAEDVTQDTFLRAWVHYASYDPDRSFDGWVLRIAVNLCIDLQRRRKRRQHLPLEAFFTDGLETETFCRELADSSNDPAERLRMQARHSDLFEGLRSLPVTYRHCLLLLIRQYSYPEIAAILGCPLGTVRSRVHRARAILRRVAARKNAQTIFA